MRIGIDPWNDSLSVVRQDAVPSRSPQIKSFYDKLTYDRNRGLFIGKVWDGTWGPGNNFDFRQFTLDEVLQSCVDAASRALARKMASE